LKEGRRRDERNETRTFEPRFPSPGSVMSASEKEKSVTAGAERHGKDVQGTTKAMTQFHHQLEAVARLMAFPRSLRG
jgi:hypothetical protein